MMGDEELARRVYMSMHPRAVMLWSDLPNRQQAPYLEIVAATRKLLEKESEYQGWENKSTWDVNVWLGNDPDRFKQACFYAKQGNHGQPLADFVRGELEMMEDTLSMLEKERHGALGLIMELAGSAIATVDWEALPEGIASGEV